MICGGFFDIDGKGEVIARQRTLSEDEKFWDDPAKAKKIMQEIAEQKEWVDEWTAVNQLVLDAEAILQLSDEARDPLLESEVQAEIDRAAEAVSKLEIRRMLSGLDDHRSALLTIHSGA